MCTVSLIHTDSDTYFLGGNRDEQKSRKKGLPPSHKIARDVAYLAPEDTTAGGTWIAVNEFGLSLAILNRYHGNDDAQILPSDPPSRGGIIPFLIHNTGLSNLKSEIKKYFNPLKYRPFTLIAVGVSEVRAARWDWNGRNFTESESEYPPRLWVSSGYDQKQVENSRKKIFDKYISENPAPSVSVLQNLHSSTEPEPGPLSISMEYKHVQTVSSTIIEVRDHQINMHYHDGLPSLNREWNSIKLKRRN